MSNHQTNKLAKIYSAFVQNKCATMVSMQTNHHHDWISKHGSWDQKGSEHRPSQRRFFFSNVVQWVAKQKSKSDDQTFKWKQAFHADKTFSTSFITCLLNNILSWTTPTFRKALSFLKFSPFWEDYLTFFSICNKNLFDNNLRMCRKNTFCHPFIKFKAFLNAVKSSCCESRVGRRIMLEFIAIQKRYQADQQAEAAVSRNGANENKNTARKLLNESAGFKSDVPRCHILLLRAQYD